MNNFNAYALALENAGPKLKELILDRAAHDKIIGLEELQMLVHRAYPEDTGL